MPVKRVLLSLLFCTYGLKVCLGQKIIENIKYQTEVGAFLSTSGQNPFWLRSNQYGIVPLESQFLTFRGAAHKEYDSTKTQNHKISKFSYGYGASTAVNVGKINQIYLPEAYFKVRYGAFEFYGGRRREIVGLVDTTLTSGSYIWSGNALPLPKIQISIPNYTSIIGNGLISIKGSYAHGWFGSQGDTKNFFLHQKTLYGRVGKPNWKVKFYGGFNHQVQWGGKPKEPYIESQTGKLITTYGNDFETYLNAVSGISLNKKGGTDIPGVPINEAWNRTGNHLGSIDIGAEINLNKLNLFVYRQSIYDDGSLYYLNNISDGLFGVSLRRKNVTNGLIGINFEYLNTTNQGGNGSSENTIPELRGMDNYFNNSLYGWGYQNNTIGTPFITPNLPSSKLYFVSNNIFTSNNLVKAILVSSKFSIKEFFVAIKFSRSNNLGIPPIYKPKLTQSSFFINFSKKVFVNYLINFSTGIDSGFLFKNTLGFNFCLSRTW